MIFTYYDIESFDNIFTLALFFENSKILEIYYLLDSTPGICLNDDLLNRTKQRIKEKNKNFDAPEENIFFFDLHEREPNERLARWIGISDADPRNNTFNLFPCISNPYPTSVPISMKTSCRTSLVTTPRIMIPLCWPHTMTNVSPLTAMRADSSPPVLRSCVASMTVFFQTNSNPICLNICFIGTIHP